MAEHEPYRVRMLRRTRLRGQLFVVGQVVDIRGDTALRSAAALVATKQARPADERTAVDVALFEALKA
jgi:hypothetical protein